jgi:hypothetical protein
VDCSCSSFTFYHKISLNPIIIDGAGMCGSCRVEVEARVWLAYVDGLEFDSQKVDL